MPQEGERPAGTSSTGQRGEVSQQVRSEFSTFYLSVQDFRFLVRNSSASIVYFECTPPIPINLSSSDFVTALYSRSSVCLEASEAFIRRVDEQAIEDLLGSSIPELLPSWRGWDRVFSRWHRNTFSSEAFELDLRNQDGTHWTAQCALYGDIQDGLLRKFWLVARDVSSQVKALHDLSTIDSHYQAMLNTPNTLSFRILPDGRCERISAAAIAIIGLARTGPLSQAAKLADLVHPDDLDNLMQVFQVRSPEPIAIRPASVRFRLREEEYGVFIARRHPIWTRSGEVESCDILATRVDAPSPDDHSVLCRSARDYHNQIAHDLNNYLMIIESHVRAALLRDPDQTLLSPALEALQGCKALNARIFDDPFDPHITRGASDITSELGRIVTLLRPLIPQTVTVVNKSGSDVVSVLAAPFELEQIFVNLLLNAAEALPNDGLISIEISREPSRQVRTVDSQWISISVQDNGPGIPRHILPFIFESGVTTKTNSQHHGLGLRSVQHLVKRLGGTISVSSNAQGTRFGIQLPLMRSPKEGSDQIKTGTVEPLPVSPSLRVLVADDEPLILESFKAMLTSLGHSIVTAHTRDAVLHSVATTKEKFDAIILDDQMPSCRASDIIQRLHDLSPTTSLIITSGDPTIARKISLAERRLTFLPKPCTSLEVTEALVAAVQSQHID